MGAYVEGYKPDEKTFTIKTATSGVSAGEKDENGIEIEGIKENGDQKFTTETNMKWRIWDYDENTRTIRLISDKPTTAKLTLKGAAGYNNGVWAINEICRRCYGQYDNNEKMKNGINVANLRRSDIQKVSTYDYADYKHEENRWEEFTDGSEEGKNIIHYGETKTYTNSRIPKMWSDYDSKWSYTYDKTKGKIGKNQGGEDPWEKELNFTNINDEEMVEAGTEFKQSYYYHIYKEDEFINQIYFDLIFEGIEEIDDRYYLAGRSACLYHHRVDLCLNGVLEKYVASGRVCKRYNIGRGKS